MRHARSVYQRTWQARKKLSRALAADVSGPNLHTQCHYPSSGGAHQTALVSPFGPCTASGRGTPMTETWRDGNSVELLINGEQFFPRVFNSIRAARREVLIETFILYEDEVGWALQRALIAAAKRGVRVELTVDDFGSAGLAKNYITPMVEAGVKVHMFDPKPRVLGVRLNIFRRLHRKIVVIDGVLGFIGGINYCIAHLVKNDPMAMQD